MSSTIAASHQSLIPTTIIGKYVQLNLWVQLSFIPMTLPSGIIHLSAEDKFLVSVDPAQPGNERVIGFAKQVFRDSTQFYNIAFELPNGIGAISARLHWKGSNSGQHIFQIIKYWNGVPFIG